MAYKTKMQTEEKTIQTKDIKVKGKIVNESIFIHLNM